MQKLCSVVTFQTFLFPTLGWVFFFSLLLILYKPQIAFMGNLTEVGFVNYLRGKKV